MLKRIDQPQRHRGTEDAHRHLPLCLSLCILCASVSVWFKLFLVVRSSNLRSNHDLTDCVRRPVFGPREMLVPWISL